MSTIWKVVVGVGVILGILGGLYGIDAKYVRLNYHEICFAQVKKDMTAIQEQIVRQRTYDEVFFWQKMEVELTQQLAVYPNDKALQKKLEGVVNKKEEAEKKLSK